MSISDEKLLNRSDVKKKLLVLDTSYSLEDIIKRGILTSVTCRDLEGYFEHVWTVHPFATIVTSPHWTPRFGKPVWHEFAPSHTFIEGKIGRFTWLKWIPGLNFLGGQIGLLLSLRRLVKNENITIIRVSDMLYLGLFGWFLSRICKIPFMVRVGGNHDKVFETTGQPMQRRLFKNRKVEKRVEHFVLSRAHLVAGANQDNLSFALSNGARKEYSTIFRYGNLLYKGHFIEPEKREDATTLLNDLGLKSNEFLMYIGRFEKVKHPDHILKVLADLRINGYDVNALLTGNGTLLSDLKNMANDLGIKDHVIFAGNQNQEWLSRVIPHAAVVISPHTGRALSEAALGGIPVVAYNIDWQRELIENEVTGLLVPYPDQPKMSEAVKRYLSDPEFAKRMADALRLRAINMLDPQKLNRHEIETYESLIRRFYK